MNDVKSCELFSFELSESYVADSNKKVASLILCLLTTDDNLLMMYNSTASGIQLRRDHCSQWSGYEC